MVALQVILYHLGAVAIERPVTLGIVSAMVVFGIIKLWNFRSRAHNLPVVKVTSNDVVGFLEDAHRKVSQSKLLTKKSASRVSFSDGLFLYSIQMSHSCYLYQGWRWLFYLTRRSKLSRHSRRLKCLSSKHLVRGFVAIAVPNNRWLRKHHYDVFLGEYSYMGTKADEFDRTMRNVLTRNTPAVLESFNAEVGYAVNKMIGPCKEWTAIKPRYAMSRIASIMSGRAFVGLPLSRQDDWVEATVNYTAGVSRAWLVLRLIPWPIRYIIAPFLPQVQALKRQKAINEEKLAPVIEEKRSGSRKDKSTPGGDMIEWFISQYSKPPNAEQLGRDQLLTTFASIYNLSNALSYVIFDLAALDPKEIELMREEVIQNVPEDGTIDKMNLPKLKRLDSFAKESQRLSPPSLGKQLRNGNVTSIPQTDLKPSKYSAYRHKSQRASLFHRPHPPLRHAYDHSRSCHQPKP
jgi:hypothetical protein